MNEILKNIKKLDYDENITTELILIDENDTIDEHNQKQIQNIARKIFTYHLKLQMAIHYEKTKDIIELKQKIDLMTDLYNKIKESYLNNQIFYKLI